MAVELERPKTQPPLELSPSQIITEGGILTNLGVCIQAARIRIVAIQEKETDITVRNLLLAEIESHCKQAREILGREVNMVEMRGLVNQFPALVAKAEQKRLAELNSPTR